MQRQGFMTIIAVAAVAVGCGTKGSGHFASSTRSVGAFTKVEARGAIELDFTGGSGPKVEIQGDDNLISHVTTKVSGGRLVLDTVGSMRPSLPLVAKVSAPSIDAIDGNGATKIRARNLTGPELSVDVSGASDAELSGAVGSLDLNLSGAGSIDTRALAADKVTIHVSGAGDVHIGAPKTLDVHISGAGSVDYAGHPTITQSISGAGSIHSR
jgi:Putative auto-transporter adhesin, head GIN domain